LTPRERLAIRERFGNAEWLQGMTMLAFTKPTNKVFVAGVHDWDPHAPIDPELLVDRRCYKTLSLRLAANSDVAVPNSLLMLQNIRAANDWVWQNWQTPLIIRVDYSKLPRKKVLGGIAISDSNVLAQLCQWLLENSYYPLIHPFLDRFRNVYSAGALLDSGGSEAQIEVVGAGFDASDLRLGSSSPHEALDVELRSGRVLARRLASVEQYGASVRRRAHTIAALRAYTQFVNNERRLLTNLSDVPVSDSERTGAADLVPGTYQPMSDAHQHELIKACQRIARDVIVCLPRSATYAASFSYFQGIGWVLWDVYADWYVR
jgi:hypothetical protein